MEQELPPDIQSALQIRLKQLDVALIEDVRRIQQDGSEKRTRVDRLIMQWLHSTVDAIAGEWVKIRLDVRDFARQMERIQSVLLEKAQEHYSLCCRLVDDRTSENELRESVRDDLRYVLSVRGRGWCRRNNERLLLGSTRRGQETPLYGESASLSLKRSIQAQPSVNEVAQQQAQPATRVDGNRGRQQLQFPKRSSWLSDRLRERGWSTSDLYRQRGPDRKTVEKILRGEAVRNDVLEKVAEALSKKHAKVSVLDIPQD